jgi:hypothetical protein
MATLRECIGRYEAAHAERISLTPVAHIRVLLDEAAAILTSVPLADEPGGWSRAELLPDIDFLSDLAGAADPRRLVSDND